MFRLLKIVHVRYVDENSDLVNILIMEVWELQLLQVHYDLYDVVNVGYVNSKVAFLL